MVMIVAGPFQRALRLIAILGLVVGLPEASKGQQTVGSGAIEGRVTDQTGGALPGVTVTATSPALQLSQVVQVTNPEGNYRFVDLPAGLYKLTFELPGFQTVIRSELRLNVGFVARIDGELRVGGVEESVTVSGQGPLVDLATTTANTNFTKEMLNTIPTTRSMWQVLSMAPGVRMTVLDVGGNQLGTQQGYKNYGTEGQNTPQIEGVNARLGEGSTMGFFDYQTFEEVQVAGVGNDASVATPGTNLLAVVKSGGNEFHGTYLFGGSSDQILQSDNLDDALRAQGVSGGSPLRYVYDVGGDLGGRLIRDKLWFYGALREQKRVTGLIGYAKAAGPDGEFGTADDVPGESPLAVSTQTLKMSYQPSSKYKVIGFYQRALKAEPENSASRFRPFETTANRQDPHVQWKGELQGSLSPQTLFTIVQGYAYYSTNYAAQPGLDFAGNPSRLDRATGIYSGPRHLQDIRPRGRWQSQGFFSYFPDRFLGGQHSFKVGYQAYAELVGTSYENKPSGNYLLIYDRIGGVRQPVEIETYNFPIKDPYNRERVYAAYATDSWRIGERLTANLGLRLDRYRVYVDEQTKQQGPFGNAGTFPAVEVITSNALAPRVGLAYSLGPKTVLKGTYGLFNHAFTEDLAGSFNPNTRITTTYRWRDQDRNGDYTPGEVNLDVNGPDFIRVAGASNNVLNPDLRQPLTHEISLGLEREVSATLSVKTLYVFKRQTRLYEAVNILRPYSAYNIPITRRDPGPDGILNSGDDAGSVTFFDYDPAYRGSQFVANQFRNRSDDRDDAFHTIELTANKRMSRSWDMLASFAATRNQRWLNGIPSNPNDEFFPLDETWDWQAKLSGAYMLPKGFLVSAFFQHLAGAPGQRTYIFRTADPDGGRPISQSSTVTLRLEPFGALRSPHQNVLNLRASKRFSMNGGRRLELMADLFNALNSNAATAVTYVAGPSFGAISGILPPRVVRFGATFSF